MLSKLPAWAIKTIHILFVLLVLLGTVGQHIDTLKSILPASAFGIVSSVVAFAAALVLWVAQHPWIDGFLGLPPGTLAGKAKAAAVGVTTALLVVLALYLTGCTPTAAVVPVTPDNQALVASCQSLSQARNALTVGDFSFGIADTAVAGVAAGLATSNPNASKDLGIGATAGAGVVAGVLVLANYYSNAYAAQGCSQVLGPLPLLPAAKPKPADPPVQVTIVKTGGAQ